MVPTAQHACDFSCSTTTRYYNRGPHEVKAVVHDHEWFKSMCGLKPCMVKSHPWFKATNRH